MRVDQGCIQEPSEGAQGLTSPEVLHEAGGVDTGGGPDQCEIDSDGLGNVIIPIHDHGSEVAVLLGTDNVDVLGAVLDTGGLDAETVLIDSDKVSISKDGKGLRVNAAEVAPDDKWGLSKGPKGEV